jgi:Uma2 family endonuclease
METTERARMTDEAEPPMGSMGHGYTQANLIMALAPHRARYTVFAELTLVLDGWEVTPDVALFPRAPVDLVRDRPKVAEAPVLAVEILSPTQSVNDLVAKAEDLLAHGVASVWLVQPALHTVVVFHPGARPRPFADDHVRDDATGITLPLDALFDPDIADAPPAQPAA